MNHERARRALSAARATDEAASAERAWALTRAEAIALVPGPRPSRWGRRRLALVPTLLAVSIAAAMSPAGAAVNRVVTRAFHLRPALRHAAAVPPAPGTVLLSGPEGTWTVTERGDWRRLGPWPEATWSPRGKYIAVAGPGMLGAVTPAGVLRWVLYRPQVHDPAWYAPSGYRVAYLSGRMLRVVRGDGSSDHLLAGPVAGVAPAWRPGHPYELAYLARDGKVVVRDGDSGALAWQAPAPPGTERLEWSADGHELMALAPAEVWLYDSAGQPRDFIGLTPGIPARDGALSPDGRQVAVATDAGLELMGLPDAVPPRQMLPGLGVRQVAFSPDGRVLVSARSGAGGWLFVSRAGGVPRALAGVSAHLGAGAAGERLDGWCCTAVGTAG